MLDEDYFACFPDITDEDLSNLSELKIGVNCLEASGEVSLLRERLSRLEAEKVALVMKYTEKIQEVQLEAQRTREDLEGKVASLKNEIEFRAEERRLERAEFEPNRKQPRNDTFSHNFLPFESSRTQRPSSSDKSLETEALVASVLGYGQNQLLKLSLQDFEEFDDIHLANTDVATQFQTARKVLMELYLTTDNLMLSIDVLLLYSVRTLKVPNYHNNIELVLLGTIPIVFVS